MSRFLTLVACGSVALSFEVDPAFTPDEQAAIWRAADQWNAITQDPITFDGNAWRIEKQDPSTTTNAINGQCRYSKRVILIHPHPIRSTTYAVALHEFGHALGLGHTEHGVMEAHQVLTEFSDEDMAECRRVGACK